MSDTAGLANYVQGETMRISKFCKSFFACCVFALLVGLTSCDNSSGGGTGAWERGFRQNEEATGSAVGFSPPHRVFVTIKLEDGLIRVVDITGPHESLQTLFVSQRDNSIRNVIENRNSFDGINRSHVHGASGATISFNAILDAGREALESLRE